MAPSSSGTTTRWPADVTTLSIDVGGTGLKASVLDPKGRHDGGSNSSRDSVSVPANDACEVAAGDRQTAPVVSSSVRRIPRPRAAWPSHSGAGIFAARIRRATRSRPRSTLERF